MRRLVALAIIFCSLSLMVSCETPDQEAARKSREASRKTTQAIISLFSSSYAVWRSQAWLSASDSEKMRQVRITTFMSPNFDLFEPEPIEGSAPGELLVSYGCPAAKSSDITAKLRRAIGWAKDEYLLERFGDLDALQGWDHIPFGDRVKLVALPNVSDILDGKQPKEWLDLITQAKVSWRGREVWCPTDGLGRSLPPGKSAADLALTEAALRRQLGK